MLELKTICYAVDPHNKSYFISISSLEGYQLIHMTQNGFYKSLFRSNTLNFYKILIDDAGNVYAFGKRPGIITKYTHHLLVIKRHQMFLTSLDDFDVLSACLFKNGHLFINTSHGVYEYSYKTDVSVLLEIPSVYMVKDILFDGSHLYGIAHLEEDILRKADGYIFKYCPYIEEFKSLQLCDSFIQLNQIKKRYEQVYVYGYEKGKEVLFSLDHHLDLKWSQANLSEKFIVP